MKVLAESTLTSKEQLTVPQAVRRLLDVHAGDSLVWSLDPKGRVVVQAGRPHSLEDVRTAVAAAGPVTDKVASPAEMKAGIASHLRKKHAGR